MKIALVAFGTRGDVQPLVGLGLRLRADGHDVVVGASEVFADWVHGHGLEFRPVGLNIEAMLQRHARTLIWSPARSVRPALEVLGLDLEVAFEQIHEAAHDAHLLVSGVHVAAPSVAEALGIPHRQLLYSPQMLRSPHHPPPGVTRFGLPRVANRLLWNALSKGLDIALGEAVNQHRRRLGLRPIGSVADHLAAQSTVVASDLVLGEVPPELSPAVPQTGAIVLHDEAPLDPALERFLEVGDPPVYVGFGSMPDLDPAGTTFLIADALGIAGRRGVICAGWAKLGRRSVPPGVFVTEETSHAALLPRVAAAVHHGGSGTTAAAARAGVPQVVVPHLADQHYWGHQIHRAGLGSRPVARRALTARKLARAIRDVLAEPRCAERAVEVRDRLATSDGVGAVTRLLYEAVENPATGRRAA